MIVKSGHSFFESHLSLVFFFGSRGGLLSPSNLNVPAPSPNQKNPKKISRADYGRALRISRAPSELTPAGLYVVRVDIHGRGSGGAVYPERVNGA